jgi:hypothetical protein
MADIELRKLQEKDLKYIERWVTPEAGVGGYEPKYLTLCLVVEYRALRRMLQKVLAAGPELWISEGTELREQAIELVTGPKEERDNEDPA